MESAEMSLSSSLSSSLVASVSFWDFLVILVLRPILATGFVLSLISLGWLFAWKLVLVHVPLVQEICGLKKKPVKSKPPIGRLSKIYSSMNAQNSASRWDPFPCKMHCQDPYQSSFGDYRS